MSKKKLRILIALLCITLFWFIGKATLHAQIDGFDCTAVSEIPLTECEALITIYETSGGPDWNNNTDWLITDMPCSWHGVECIVDHVVSLELPANRLTQIPADIGNLTDLNRLDLDNNQLSTLPAEIMSLPLNLLGVHFNRLQIEDDRLTDFLTKVDDMWAETQTVPPKDFSAIAESDTMLSLTWMPITYSQDGGHYEISYATESDGPYIIHGTTTDKATGFYEIDELSAATIYHIRVRTYSMNPRDEELWSEESATISVMTQAQPTLTPIGTVVPMETPPPTTTRVFTETSTETATLTPTATSTPSPTSTMTSTMTSTSTVTPSVTSSATASMTPTITSTVTEIPSATPANTTLPATATLTATPTSTPTPTSTGTATLTATSTATSTVTSTVTSTITDTATSTATPTSTPIPTETETSTGTSTGTPTSTETMVATVTATATEIWAPVAPTETSAATPTSTLSPTSTATLTPIPSASVDTATPSPVPTYTPLPTYTLQPTYTIIPTNTPIATPTEISTETATLISTLISTLTPTGTSIATSTETSTPISTATFTVTPTVTPTATPSATNTLTATASPTARPMSTLLPTMTPTLVCYHLTLIKEGAGELPTVSPDSSGGCPDRHYTYDEYIELDAQPATEWLIERWQGTEDDSRKTKSNTLHMPTGTHTVTVTYGLLSPSEPIAPLAVTCSDFTSSDPDFTTACLVGMVYVDGQPGADINVTITNQAGKSAPAYAQHRSSGPESRPYYQVNLNTEPLWIMPSQTFTVHVDYNNVVKHKKVIAESGRQQVDIVLPQENAERPIATISYLSDNNFVQGEVLIAYGSGQSQRADGEIIAYRWTSDRNDILGETAPLALQVNNLTPGRHELSFQVQDERGAWSAPVQEDIYVARSSQVEWAMLLYLAGDYHDGGKQWDAFQYALNRLRETVAEPELRIVAQVDGFDQDTERWIIEPGQGVQASQFSKELIGEAAMDDHATLAEFIRWGQEQFPAKHYYLVIADHGQGARGIAWDTTSDLADDGERNDSAYLTIKELGEALDADNVAPVDVLHLDACSMNLVEVAYEVRNRTQVLVSSQYLAWDYFAYPRYAGLIDGDTTPNDLGRGIVQSYSSLVARDGLPYTISALDMKRSVKALTALDALAGELATQVRSGEIDAGLLKSIRDAAQSFDSEGNFQNDQDDLYIDLKHWATLLQSRVDDFDIRRKAADLASVLEEFILANRRGSGPLDILEIALEGASGISIFYPNTPDHETHKRYTNHELFEFTRHSRWTSFLHASLGPSQPDVTPTPESNPQTFLERGGNNSVTPTPVLTPTVFPATVIPATETATSTPAATSTAIPTATLMPTAIPSAVATALPTSTGTPTATPMPMPTETSPCSLADAEDEDCVSGEVSGGARLYLPIIQR